MWWPLGAHLLWLPGALIAVAVAAGSIGSLSWPWQEWPTTSAGFHERFALAGPIAAAAAAYVATRLSPRSRIFLAADGDRLGAAVVVRQIALMIAVTLVSYLVGLSPSVVATAANSDYGRPDALVIASGLLAMAAAVGVGYAIGALCRNSLCVPVVFIAVLYLGASLFNWSTLTPVDQMDPPLGWHESVPMVVFRCVFFVSCLVAAVVAASVQAAGPARRARASVVGSAGIAVVLVVPVVLGVLGESRTIVRSAPDASAPMTCRRLEGVEYCVHNGHRAVIDELINVSAPVAARYGTLPERAKRISDASLLRDPDHGESALWITLQPDSYSEAEVRDQVSWQLVLAPCWEDALPQGLFDQIGNLQLWLVSGEHQDASSDRFAGMDSGAMRDWISRHRGELEACTLEVSDLPRNS